MGRRGVVLLLAATLGVLALVWWLLSAEAREAPAASSAIAAEPLDEDVPSFATEAVEHPVDALAIDDTGGPLIVEPAAAAAPAAGGELVFHVEHAHGAPAAGALVLLARGDTPQDSARLDADGKASLPALEWPTDIGAWIAGATPWPVHVDLERGAGEQRVRLPEGGIVSGIVLLDGAEPPSPIPLGLGPSSYKVGDPEIAWSLQEAMQQDAPGKAWSTVDAAQLTGPGGRFLFSGQPRDRRVSLVFPSCFRLRGEQQDEEDLGVWPVTRSGQGLVLDLVRVASVRGRVIEAGGVPVAAAQVDSRLTFLGGGFTGELVADAGGVFELPMLHGALHSLTLDIAHPEGRAARRWEVGAVGAEGRDLGDMELSLARCVTFVASDVDGRPVPSALAVSDDAAAVRSSRTDEQGRGVLSAVAFDCSSFTVLAHGYEAAQAGLPADPDEVVSVVLQPTTLLTIIVRDSRGEVPVHLELVFESDGDVFPANELMVPSALRKELGASSPRRSSTMGSRGSGSRSGDMAFDLSWSDTIAVDDIAPAVPFELSLIDDVGCLVWGPTTLSLQRGERREVRIEVTREPRPITGRVTDARGLPASKAEVTLADARNPPRLTGSQRVQARTDEEGRFETTPIYADELDILVRGAGPSARLLLTGVRVPPVGVPLQLVLPDGVPIEVCVEDERGQALPGSFSVAARVAGVVVDGPIAGTDRCRTLRAVPPGRFEIAVNAGGHDFRQAHDTATPRAVVVVPEPGALHVRWPGPLPRTLASRLYITDLDTNHEIDLALEADGAPEFDVPVLFPGRYEVWITALDPQLHRSVDLSSRETVDVVAGATAEVALSL